MLGYRTYRTADQSTNCWWVALLSFGEGWHNNHHAFPFSARHGLRWFEIDMTWWQVRALAVLRLADHVRLPSEVMRRKLAYATARSSAPGTNGPSGTADSEADDGVYYRGSHLTVRRTA